MLVTTRQIIHTHTTPSTQVVLVLDTSGSMSMENRLELAKQAADAVIDTLT